MLDTPQRNSCNPSPYVEYHSGRIIVVIAAFYATCVVESLQRGRNKRLEVTSAGDGDDFLFGWFMMLRDFGVGL